MAGCLTGKGYDQSQTTNDVNAPRSGKLVTTDNVKGTGLFFVRTSGFFTFCLTWDVTCTECLNYIQQYSRSDIEIQKERVCYHYVWYVTLSRWQHICSLHDAPQKRLMCLHVINSTSVFLVNYTYFNNILPIQHKRISCDGTWHENAKSNTSKKSEKFEKISRLLNIYTRLVKTHPV